jgi:2-amino-4-hydroxy-6-hydroxymethyldihydropteridine diphosphokinase
MAVVYIALGTNLGDRLANLEAAISSMPPAVRVTGRSPVYQTAPWGYPDQPDFFNQVIQAETDLTPQELITYLKWLEKNLGRIPTFRNGPRLIDLDILFYDELVMDSPPLSIPHPRLAERAFVLVPLADLAPGLRHPVLGKTVGELLHAIDSSEVKPLVQ